MDKIIELKVDDCICVYIFVYLVSKKKIIFKMVIWYINLWKFGIENGVIYVLIW